MSWPLVKLGELVTIKGGGTPSKKIEEYWNGNIPWASVKDLKSNEISKTVDTITELGVNNSATNVIPAGTILTATRMALGKFAINTVDMAINQDLKALFINNETKVDRDFLIRFLESQAQFIDSEGKGATVKGITLDFLKSLEIPLPPLDEQKRIAAILDKADAIRRKRQQAIPLADDFLRSVFLDMFGDPNVTDNRWRSITIGELGGNENSKRVPLKQADRDLREGVFPYFGATGIIDHLDDYIFDGNFLLIAEDGKNLLNRTKPLAFPAKGKFWVNNHAHVLSDTGEINLTYLEYSLNFKDIRSHVTGIDQFKLNRTSLDRIKVFNPPMKLQNKFEAIVIKTKSTQLDAFTALKESHNCFNSLSQKAFAGEL